MVTSSTIGSQGAPTDEVRRQPVDGGQRNLVEQAPLDSHGVGRPDRGIGGDHPRRLRDRVVAAVESRIEQLGTNTLTVINQGRFGRGRAVTGTQTAQANLTIADVNAIGDPANAPDVQSVSPVLSTSVTSTYDGATYTTSVIGSTPSYLTSDDYMVASGQAITETEVQRHDRVVDIGADVEDNLFSGDPTRSVKSSSWARRTSRS